MECGYDRDRPESNFGAFAFIAKVEPLVRVEVPEEVPVFRPRCPKCGSRSPSVHKERGTSWITPGENTILVLHCSSCGKELSGRASEEEIERQHAEFERASE